jgi:hypothetical protein
MKKSISISLSVLMVLGMVHFSVATHYCSEMEATSKVSLSGKLASCGMEETTESCPVSGINLTSHCCDDVVSFYGIDSNYTPSFSVVPEFYQYTFQVFDVPIGLTVASADFVKTSYPSAYPPGVLMSTNVDLCDICVFRI